MTVTATLDAAGVGWPAAAGRLADSDTTATFTVTFAAVACTPVAPAAPAVTQATCTNGVVTPPTVTLPPTTGIIYVLDPADLGDGTQDVEVTVTATVVDGFGWDQLPADWTRVDATTATFTVSWSGRRATRSRWRRR